MPRRRLCRCLKISGTRLDAGNCVASRLFPQQIPGFLVLTVLLISQLGTEKKTGLACNLLCRNDEPRVCWNQVDRGKIKGTAYVSPTLTSAHLTASSAVTLMSGGFDLHQKTLRIMLYHKVIAGRISKRLAYLELVFCGTRHKQHLHPFSPLLVMFERHFLSFKKRCQLGPRFLICTL